MASVRALLADDYEPYRWLIRELLARQPEVEVVGEADSGQDAVSKTLELEPDVVLLDISLRDVSSLEALRCIKERSPDVKVIVMLDEDDRIYRSVVLESGAVACVPKVRAGDILPWLINRI